MKTCGLILCLILFVSAFPPAVIADTQDNGALRLETSPLPIDLATDPGKPVTTTLKIRNIGNHPETLKLGLLTFKAGDTSGAPQLRERRPGDDFFDWVTFSQPQFTVAPFEWKTISMTITPPKTAAFGYYYAVTFSRASDTVSDVGTNALLGSTATLVLLDVRSPLAKRELTLSSFTTDRPWYEFLPVTFTVTLRNTGNVHVVPHGTIFLSQNGHDVDNLSVNQANGNVLPQSTRDFQAMWERGFPSYHEKTDQGHVVLDSSGHAVQQLSWQLNHADWWRFGHYTAKLVLAYDNGHHDVPITATVSFWIIPWRLFLIAIAIPVIPAVLMYLFMRWRMRRAMERL